METKKKLAEIPLHYSELIPEPVAREQCILPLGKKDETIYVASVSDSDILMQDKLRFLLNADIFLTQFPKAEILSAINRLYGYMEGESADSLLQEFSDTAIDFTETDNDDVDLCTLHSFGTEPARRKRYARPRTSNRDLQLAAKANFSNQNELIEHENRTPRNQGMFYYTVNEGQQVLAYRRNGSIDKIVGPARVWKGSTEFRMMEHFVAHPGSFLVVQFKDGTQQNIVGPAEIWLDPRVHSSITLQEGLALAAKEAVVVYGQDESGNTNRRICTGPTSFVPQPGEWLHQFSWHASRGGSKGVEKKPNGLQFQKLWLMPDQMYHDVKDVRTADDAVLVVRLMLFFELLDIEKMLDTTHDPIGDFINAATSDVVEFTGKRTFEEFKQETDQLNDLETYSQLLHRAEQCGYRINNVVYRGYGAPESLQKMHDEAIQARTRLQLEKATETQTQELEDYRLKCQVERSEKRRVEQTTEVEHDLLIQQKREASKLEAMRQQEEFKREQKRSAAEQESDLLRKQQEIQREHFDQLRSMGVDLTQYLTQGRADQVIELRGRGGNQPHLHLSQNGTAKKSKNNGTE